MRSTWPGARSGRSLMTTSPPVERVKVRVLASAIVLLLGIEDVGARM